MATKNKSLMDAVEKYNEGAKESVAVGEKNTRDAGNAAADSFKKGNYGTAAKEVAKGLGSAAKTLAVDVPTEAFRAGMNRLTNGEKMADVKYPKDVPVDEPVAKPKQSKAKMYPNSAPVDEPVVKKAKGGSIRGGGIESRGKTKGKMITMCSGGMSRGKK